MNAIPANELSCRSGKDDELERLTWVGVFPAEEAYPRENPMSGEVTLSTIPSLGPPEAASNPWKVAYPNLN